MKKFRLSNGLIAYKTTTPEIISIGGFGICDSCCNYQHDVGYLVPVLGWWMCKDCFDDWSSRAIRYPEDDEHERQVCRMYEKLLPCEVLTDE